MWVVTLHNLFLYPEPPLTCHPPSYWIRLFSNETFSRIHTPTFLKPSHSSHIPAYEDGRDSVPKRSDVEELPRRTATTFRTGRKFEIKKINFLSVWRRVLWHITNVEEEPAASHCRVWEWPWRCGKTVLLKFLVHMYQTARRHKPACSSVHPDRRHSPKSHTQYPQVTVDTDRTSHTDIPHLPFMQSARAANTQPLNVISNLPWLYEPEVG
jgi:hypothetical protein